VIDKSEERLRLADRSARRGLGALGRFLERRVDPASPRCEWSELHRVEAASGLTGARIGLFSDIDGALGGKLGLLLPRSAAPALVRDIVGSGNQEREWMQLSALLEGANIAFSAAVGALGDALGLIVFPSVPRLVLELKTELAHEEATPADRDAAGAYLAHAQLVDHSGVVHVAYAWIPACSDVALS
jgi:chemotaxis protein CheY-P-specific phosphatase CheC